MADSRLTRGMNPAEAESFELWVKASAVHLKHIAATLEAACASSQLAADDAATFDKPNPLAALAHQAGRREGLREACRLLVGRGA